MKAVVNNITSAVTYEPNSRTQNHIKINKKSPKLENLKVSNE